MTQEEIVEGNRLIAEFMGTKRGSLYLDMDASVPGEFELLCSEKELEYHSSCDWLMPVIIEIGNRTGYELVIGWEYSFWNKFGEKPFESEFGGYVDVKNLWTAVVEFIKWYNNECNDDKRREKGQN